MSRHDGTAVTPPRPMRLAPARLPSSRPHGRADVIALSCTRASPTSIGANPIQAAGPPPLDAANPRVPV